MRSFLENTHTQYMTQRGICHTIMPVSSNRPQELGEKSSPWPRGKIQKSQAYGGTGQYIRP